MFKVRLKSLREGMGMTQQEFADTFGVSKGTIGMWESGAREPKSLEDLRRIAVFFGVSTDYLLGQDKKRPAPMDGDGLSEEQRDLIRLFGEASPEIQAAALAVLRSAEGQDKAQDGASAAK